MEYTGDFVRVILSLVIPLVVLHFALATLAFDDPLQVLLRAGKLLPAAIEQQSLLVIKVSVTLKAPIDHRWV